MVLGATAAFHVEATACPPPNYQWYFNGAGIAGATHSSLQITNVQPTNAGTYWAVLSNTAWGNYYGVVHTSGSATLTVLGKPSITNQPMSQIGYWGKSVTFGVTATGIPPPSYQWQKDGASITGATNTSLVLTNLQATNAGRYTVVVTNSVGSITSSNAYLIMNPAGVSLALYPGVTIDGVTGLAYGIQYSADLRNTNGWQGMTNLTPDVPTELWFDLQPATQRQRFYRVVPGPISVP